MIWIWGFLVGQVIIMVLRHRLTTKWKAERATWEQRNAMHSRHLEHLAGLLVAQSRGEVTWGQVMGEILAMQAEQYAANPQAFPAAPGGEQ